MSQGKRGRTHPLLYILSGIFAGILIGFGTALLIQNPDVMGIVPGLHSRHDTTAIQSKADHAPDSRSKRGTSAYQNNFNDSGQSPIMETLNDNSDSSFVADSFVDTLITGSLDDGDIVRRDEMIGTKLVKLHISDEPAGRKPGSHSPADTLLTALTSVKLPEGYYQEYMLEFWQNPLNYKGYRVTRDKIVLFGMPVDQSYSVRLSEGNLLLVAGKQQYLLKESTTFIPLIPKKL